MNIPPLVRVGTVPLEAISPKASFIVLTQSGWFDVRSSIARGAWENCDRYAPATQRFIAFREVLCWMPGDGS